MDVDCVPNTTAINLERLAVALRHLNARLRVGGMTDEEARQLPVQLDAEIVAAFGSSTWMTDAGPLDLLVELRDRDGGRHQYADLLGRAVRYEVGTVTVLLAAWTTSSNPSSSPAETRIAKVCPNCWSSKAPDEPALLLRPIIGTGSRRPRRPAIARGRVAPITLRQLNSTDGGQRSDGGSCSVVGRAGIRVPA